MRPFNQLDCAAAERLAVLAEEAGEVVQAVTKILRHGYDRVHPVSRIPNRVSLEKELGDFLVAMGMLVTTRDVSEESILKYAALKGKEKGKYLHHNRPKSCLEEI